MSKSIKTNAIISFEIDLGWLYLFKLNQK
jgi:hypothetical protein